MKKEEFIGFIGDFTDVKSLSPRCRSTIKTLIKKVKTMDEQSFLQFMELMSIYCADFTEYVDNMINGVDDKKCNTEEEFVQMMKDFTKSLGAELEVAEFDPSYGEYVDSSGRPIMGLPSSTKRSKYHQDEPDDVDFIKRRPLAAEISPSGFAINESFMTYLNEIKDIGKPPKQFNPYNEDYADDNDEDLGIAIGTRENKENSTTELVITIFGGVSSVETFHFIENNNGYGIMDPYDFKYFKLLKKNTLDGMYIFELDKTNKYFIGKKVM